MEKLVYVVWKATDSAVEVFRDVLLGECATQLLDLGAQKLAVSLADEHVCYARESIITHMEEPITGVVCFWLGTHLDRAPAEEVIRGVTSRYAGYLVLESVPRANTTCRASLGERTPGVNTIGFLEKPDRLSYDQWLAHWQGQHTRVALETQSTFLYIQNAVVRAVTEAAPPWVAIVEEGFPSAAMTNPKVFYDAGDSAAKLTENRARMIESCRRFIDFDRLESHVFSQYVLSE
jgi:hypothetical protein